MNNNPLTVLKYTTNTLTTLTAKDTGTSRSLDSNITNGETTNIQGIKGINVAPQLMKFRTYNIDGGCPAGGAGNNFVLQSNSGAAVDINSSAVIYGQAYTKAFYGQLTPAGSTAKNVLIDYVDSSGNEVLAAPFAITTTNTLLFSGWGINRCYLATNTAQQALSSTETIYITYTQNSVIMYPSTIVRSGESQTSITVPNNAIAVITSAAYFSQAQNDLYFNRFSSNGTKIKMRYLPAASVNNFFQISANMSDAGVCGVYVAGDTIVFNSSNPASTYTRISANVNIIYLT